jgi:tetratricopeptide (TPR) repeat protein
MASKYSEDHLFQTQLRAKIAGELKGEALEELNKAIATSPEAADEARFSGKLSQALRHEDKLQMNTLIGAIITSEGLPPTPPKSGPWGSALGWLLGLALLSVSGVIGYNAWFAGQLKSPAQLYERHFSPLENIIVTPENTGGLAGLDSGMEAYDRGDYAQASALLGNYYQQIGDPNAGLFLGVALLQQGNHKDALVPLQNSMRNLQPPALDACRWYLALALLKDDNPALARNVLRGIPEESVYGEQSKQLLVDMEKLSKPHE